MGIIIDGKLVAQENRIKIKDFVDNRIKNNLRVPCMAVILAGDDGGSVFYINSEEKLCKKLGVRMKKVILDKNITQDSLIDVIDKLNSDDEVDGIMLLLPLPENIDQKKVTSAISYKKDIDCLTDINNGKFYKKEKSFIPCTAKAVIEAIKSTKIDITGMNAVVIGRSNIVGKPVAQLLLNENATVTVCHSKTKNLPEICKNADIVVSAVGRPHLINKDYIKKGAIVIDVGTTRVNGKIQGDVCFDDVKDEAGYITPVPGGIGSITTTMLLKNVCEAAEKNVY